MKAGRLTILNESSFPTPVVKDLVRFGTQDLDVKGEKLLAVVRDARSRTWYSGKAADLHRDGHRRQMPKENIALARKHNARFLIRMSVPPTVTWKPQRRLGIVLDYRTWDEILAGLTAHEAQHIQHYYDNVYGKRSLVTRSDYEDGIAYRVLGDQRVEPRCRAAEEHMLRRYREHQHAEWDRLVAEAAGLGYTVERLPYCETADAPGILGARVGVCVPSVKRIIVREVLGMQDRLRVLGHELEHARGAGDEIDGHARPLLDYEREAVWQHA